MNRPLLLLSVMLLGHASCADPDFGRTAAQLTQITTDAMPPVNPVCGNARVEMPEECDDGNTRNEDGCSSECKYEYCSDGILQKALGEECDDGNFRNDDGCDMFCQIERPPPRDAGVPRDAPPPPPMDAPPPPRDAPPPPPVDAPPPWDGPLPPPEGPVPECGNGMVEYGEECDDGNTSNNDGCDSTCKYEYCGDGVVQAPLGEQCDDGGYRNDDGCDMFCQIERYPSFREPAVDPASRAP